MFGSKLRSWMENHIVRPRKKSNKNKNGNSGNLASSSTQNGHKGTSYQGDSTTTSAIASPARRSEVSPIQCHTTSRAGWQSPEDHTVSPKSDHYYYHHQTIKSNSSPKNNMIRNSSYTLETNSNTNPQHYPQQSYLYSKSVDSKQLSKTIDFHKRKEDYSRQSNNPFNSSTKHLSTTSASSSTSNEMLEAPLPISTNSKQKNIAAAAAAAAVDSNHIGRKERTGKLENQFSVENNPMRRIESSSSTTTVANMKKLEIDGSTKRDEYNQSAAVNGPMGNGKSLSSFGKQIDENRYGKILNRNGANNCGTAAAGAGGRTAIEEDENFTTNQGNNYDRYNANIQQYQSTRCDNTNMANNNTQLHQNNHLPYHPPTAQSQQYTNANGNSYAGSGKSHPGLLAANAAAVRRTGSETNRNMLRTNRYPPSNGTHLTAPGVGNHQLAHMINSLSSPESAYSTGYSTDGTSPGASYTPEYYINMRTGTHYFPRGVSSVAIEQSRQKFGLNKIDESTAGEISSVVIHRRTESCDLNNSRNSVPNILSNGNVLNGHLTTSPSAAHPGGIPTTGLSPDLQRRLALQSYKGLESPSPRQRCRIKTNPWFSNVDPAVTGHITFNSRRMEMDTSSTSSGIKSSSDAAEEKTGKKILSSESDSSSSSTETEVINKPLFSPTTIRKRKTELNSIKDTPSSIDQQHVSNGPTQCESDEDTTLNEMMGKFDESYCYEKETDILSDSDPTECISDLDTGQDGGDECDTDDLLDLDFIDNGSTQEIIDKNLFENKGSCTYYNIQSDRRVARLKKGRKNEDTPNARRKKRLTRTRKRVSESNDMTNGNDASLSNSCERGSKSLGGTPLCLRRNQSEDNKDSSELNPLGYRSNSLTFTEIHSIRSRFLAIAESEKALLKADMEADVKYKQLIHEAETILVSMKTTTSSRDTPAGSPSRRTCNVPTNKRVEMLRNCEADLRRELAKAQAKAIENGELPPVPPRKNPPSDITDAPLSSTFQDNLLINKRIESLKFESNSAPNSPKSCRFSPRKTHVTNFINQNAAPTDLLRRRSSPEPSNKVEPDSGGKLSPQLQLNGRKMISPPKSPTPRRRFRSQSPKVVIDSDSDTDTGQKSTKRIQKRGGFIEMNGNKENYGQRNSNRKTKLKSENKIKICQDDILNQNVPSSTIHQHQHTYYDAAAAVGKKPLMSFRSIDMGNKDSEISYCPQSEPLKRKIYSGSSTLEKLKKSLEMDADIPKKVLLDKISMLRRERYIRTQTDKIIDSNDTINTTNCYNNDIENNSDNAVNICNKRQLILNTIEDLKRSLEDQSVELCGLNDEDD